VGPPGGTEVRSSALFLAVVAVPVLAQNPCAQPDNLTRVDGNGKCLVVHTFPAAEKKSGALVVWIHGGVSSGGAADYMVRYARQQSEREGVTSVVLLRPGCFDSKGNTSAGNDGGRRDNYTEENVDAVAGALVNLKKHHGARKLLVVGHSGGAATAAVILGRHPGVIDAAYLFSCPCNLMAWKPQFYRSISPSSVADKVPPSSRVYAFTGARDGNTGPGLARDYVASLAARSVTAEFHEIPAQSHNLNPAMVGFEPFGAALRKELQ
jgi:pimeloyl-ACP methyl ester carboxylesterase